MLRLQIKCTSVSTHISTSLSWTKRLPCVPIASFHSWTFHWSIFGCSVPWPLQRTLLPQNQSHHGKIWQDVSQGNMQLNDVTLHVTWGYMRLHEVICRQGKLWHTHTYIYIKWAKHIKNDKWDEEICIESSAIASGWFCPWKSTNCLRYLNSRSCSHDGSRPRWILLCLINLIN